MSLNRKRGTKIERIEVQVAKRSSSNRYKVPLRQWKRWSPLGRAVFNEMYSTMKMNHEFFLHPNAVKARATHWTTTCWNAAWTAADAVDRD